MLRIFLSIWFLTASVTFSLSQDVLSGMIKDMNSNPIPYVNIGIPKKGLGTVSDHAGRYHIDFADKDDTIKISAIGFQDLDMLYADLESNPEVVLREADYIMEEVEIIGKRLIEKQIRVGSRNKKRGQSLGFGSKQLGSEIGAVLRFDNPTFITSAHFVINHAKGDSMLFRVKMYELDSDKVGSQIIGQNVLIREKQKKGTISVDLSSLELTLEGKYLLSLEWVQDIDGKGNEGITVDTKSESKDGGTYMKLSSVGQFQKIGYLKNLRPCFYILGKEYQSD